MTAFERHLVIALAISALFILFNIVVVTSGDAEYYNNVSQVLGMAPMAN